MTNEGCETLGGKREQEASYKPREYCEEYKKKEEKANIS